MSTQKYEEVTRQRRGHGGQTLLRAWSGYIVGKERARGGRCEDTGAETGASHSFLGRYRMVATMYLKPGCIELHLDGKA